jgi:ABC-type lipoprotein release transport system permease subunit
MSLLKLAWRNVFRHKRRTLITSAAISVGLAAMIASNTMMNGAEKMASANIIDYETGHLEIFAEGYYRAEGLFPLDTIIDQPEQVFNSIAHISGITGMTARVKFPARVTNGIDEFPVLGVGIDPRTETDVFRFNKAIVKGHDIEESEDILIGTDLATIMDVSEGSFLTIITRDKNGTYNAYDCRIVGIVNTQHPLFDGNAVIMDIGFAQELLALGSSVTEISVRIRDESRILDVKAAVQSAVGAGFEVYTYRELYSAIFEVSGFKRLMQFIIALVVIIIAAVGIVNTMLMAVMERIPEIGTLKAMGFHNKDVIKMFLYEGSIIGFFGSILGCVFGLIISLLLVFIGIDLSSVFDSGDFGYPVELVIKGEIDPILVLIVFLFGIAVSVLVTLWPVRRATRLQPVDALRHV